MQKFLFLVFAIFLIGFAVYIVRETLTLSTGIPTEAINRLLFRVSDNLKNEILSLGDDKITEFQSVSQITPAQGYFGSLTQSKIVAYLVKKSLAAEQAHSRLSSQQP